jgi:hypothetical protein
LLTQSTKKKHSEFSAFNPHQSSSLSVCGGLNSVAALYAVMTCESCFGFRMMTLLFNLHNPQLKPPFSVPAILTQPAFAVRYASFRGHQGFDC